MVKKVPKKRGWAKNDIADVEDALEDERLVSKLKAKGRSQKKDKEDDDGDDLFTVDTKGSFEGISKTSRRELARAKLFPPKGPNIGMTVTEELKVIKAERQVEAARRPVKPPPSDVFDLWGEATPLPSKRRPEHKEWRIRTAADPKMVNKPGTMHQKVGLAPAVLPAHEGQSMNPHREAYEDLACMAAAAELDREREEEELNRKMYPMRHELIDAVGYEKFKEMSEEEKMALYRKLNKNNSSGSAGVDADGTYLKESMRWKQKTQASKSKKKRRKGLDAQEEQEKAKLRLEKQVGDVGTLMKGLQDESEWRQSRKEYRLSQRAKRKELESTEGVVPKKRKIGGGRYAEEAAILPDADSGARGMRAMPLRTSAIKERLASVVRRGLLPPPSENTREVSNFHRKKNNKIRRSKKFMSPLLRDNLLLR